MTQRRFPWASTFILGFGFFGISIIWPLFNSLIPPMLKSLGLTAGITGFVLTWDNTRKDNIRIDTENLPGTLFRWIPA